MDIKEEKASMRSSVRRACKAMDAAERRTLSEAACEYLSDMPQFQRAELILAYMAMPHECDPAQAVELAWKQGKKVAFPLCEDGYSLGLYVPSASNAFVKGKYGILEPDVRRSVRVAPSEIDCAVIPGVAFDIRGGRLGQGAGYYDRFLAQTDAFRIGLCFPIQIKECVPTEETDRFMDALVSAKGRYFTRNT